MKKFHWELSLKLRVQNRMHKSVMWHELSPIMQTAIRPNLYVLKNLRELSTNLSEMEGSVRSRAGVELYKWAEPKGVG
jgi:hypothetical protein